MKVGKVKTAFIVILCGVFACATDSVVESQVISNLCQDGDTVCQCNGNPGLPQCGDIPNAYDMQDTIDYALTQGIDGADTPGRTSCSTFGSVTTCNTWGHFLGHTWSVNCEFTDAVDGSRRKTCTSSITPT